MAKRTADERDSSLAFLKGILKKDSVVYTDIARVSRDGMSRSIKVFVAHDGEILNVSRQVADVLGWRFSKKNAVVVGGCGMDMGFHTIYSISHAIFNDETKDRAGYCLTHRWV